MIKQLSEEEIKARPAKLKNNYKPRDIDAEIFDKLKIKNMKLYTDGGCRVHSDKTPGAHACIVVNDENKSILEYNSGIEWNTTNNEQELMAMRKALQLVRRGNWSGCTIYTDSEYVKKGLTEWCKSWKNNKWRTSTNKDVKNKELWVELDALYTAKGGMIEIKWVRAHNGNQWNEAVDALCTNIIDKFTR